MAFRVLMDIVRVTFGRHVNKYVVDLALWRLPSTCRHSKNARGRPEEGRPFRREEVATVKSIMQRFRAATSPVDAFAHVATSDLAVYERAVTVRPTGGELCPLSGWEITSRPATSGDLGAIQRPGSGTTAISSSTFKPRLGSHAISGTG